MALMRLVFETVENFRAPGPHDGIGRLWMRLPTARWPKSILVWQDGRVVQKVSPSDYELGTAMANDQAIPVNPDPPDEVYLGGHEYLIDVASWQYPVLVAAGVTLEPQYGDEFIDTFTETF